MDATADKPLHDIAALLAETKKGVTDPFPYDRLMIYYRKEKDYKRELQIINKAINVFQMQQQKLQDKAFAKNKKRQLIEDLSNAINKSAGLTDKKGKPTFVPEPVARWLKRKIIVEKKINA